MSFKQFMFLMLAGVGASVGQFSITTAYKYAPAKEISVFDYTQVIFAAIWGMIFLGEIPVMLSIIGYIIIIGMAVLRWYYNLHHLD
jgi:drug/metabolite transporter (DMT)-like permease